jgi:hypothetical protein
MTANLNLMERKTIKIVNPTDDNKEKTSETGELDKVESSLNRQPTKSDEHVLPGAPEYLMKGMQKVLKEFSSQVPISKIASGFTSHFKYLLKKNEESHSKQTKAELVAMFASEAGRVNEVH